MTVYKKTALTALGLVLGLSVLGSAAQATLRDGGNAPVPSKKKKQKTQSNIIVVKPPRNQQPAYDQGWGNDPYANDNGWSNAPTWNDPTVADDYPPLDDEPIWGNRQRAPVRQRYGQVVTVPGAGSDQDPVEAQRLAAEEARLGRPMTAGEKEVKVAMDKFVYQPRVNMPFLITRTEWTEEDEIKFGQFVASIGQGVKDGKCGTATKCMRDPSINPYAPYDPPTMALYTDCADLPYTLRAYYAYHEGLPFSYVTEIAVNPTAYTSLDDRQKDLLNSSPANSPYGNRIVSRGGSNVPPGRGQERQFLAYVQNLIDITGTATNRVGPMTPGVERSDIFPVPLNRRGVRPGSIIAATGHAMIVWKVTATGEIRIIDGHPGSFIQEHLLDASMIKMSRPDQGIGYYQFRPLRLVNAKLTSNGTYVGGQVQPISNSELIAQGRYSLEQFFGPGSLVFPGDRVDPEMWKNAYRGTSVFQYLADNLRQKGLKADAVEFVKGKFDYLCGAFQERMKNYANSQQAGVAAQEHPQTLEKDIFGAADATWEKFSTPGGDSRLRDSIKGLVNDAANAFRASKNGGSYTFKGSAQDYVNSLRRALADKNASCKLFYTNSAGARVNLTLNGVTARMNRLSFDPYMCAEKSWGASGAELATCRDRDVNNQWYEAEKYLRNVIGKTDDEGNASIRSNAPISIDMLLNMANVDQPSSAEVSLGTSAAPPMNLDAIFASDAFMKRLSQ